MPTYRQLHPLAQEEVKQRYIKGERAVDLEREYQMPYKHLIKTGWRLGWNVLRAIENTPQVTKDIVAKRDARVSQVQKPAESFERDVQMERLRAQNKILGQKLKEAVKGTATVDRVMEVLKDTTIASEPVEVFSTAPLGLTGDKHAAVALLSDVHMGEVVEAGETNGLANYDMATCYERAQIWVEKVVGLTELRRSRMDIPDLHLFMLGDIISGDIHDELSNSNEVPVIVQTQEAARLFSSAALTLSQHYENVYISVVAGNHGRMKKKPYYKNKQIANWDVLVGQIMALRLKNQSNIHFHIPEAFWTIRDVLGTKFFLMHGDGVKSWNSIPWYGVDRVTKSLLDMVGRDVMFDRVAMGHFHNPVDTESWHINGSFKGGDEYSIGAVYAAGRPSQTMLYVHPEMGVVSTERVYLDNGIKKRFETKEALWVD